MTDETPPRPSRALTRPGNDRTQPVTDEMVFVPHAPTNADKPPAHDLAQPGRRNLPDLEWDSNGFARFDEPGPRQRRFGERSEASEPVDRFVERPDRFADTIDRFAGPARPPTGVAGRSVFGEAFALSGVEFDADDHPQPFADQRVPVGPARSDWVPSTDWPPIPTGMFPSRVADEALLARPPAGSVEPATAFADDPQFAAPVSAAFGTPALGHAPALVFSDARETVEDDVLVRLVSEPWRPSAGASADPGREIVLRSRSEIRGPAVTVLFALAVIAGVLLAIYLATQLLR